MKEEKLYKDIYDKNSLVRMDACQNILDLHKIPLKIREVRKVFPLILSEDIYKLKNEGINRFELAEKNLKQFIKEFGIPQDFRNFSHEQLDDALLDECYKDKPGLGIISELVSLGADINTADKIGWTAFMYGVKHQNYAVMNFFLEHGADINTEWVYSAEPKFRETVWLRSLRYAKPEYIRLMMAHGADVFDMDSEGNTILHIYCDGNPCREMLKLLIEKNPAVDSQNNQGDTPLHLLALKTNTYDCIEYLVDHGAGLNIRNNPGKTPLHNACYVYGTCEEITSFLLLKGADPNVQDEEGDTPLFIAVYRENKCLIKHLLKAGTDPLIRNRKGKTAYRIALEKGFIHIAEEIDRKKASIDYKKQPHYKRLKKIKEKIIAGMKAGKYKYYSDKEGDGRFYYKDGRYVYDRYHEGHEPPISTCYETDEDALQFLYDKSIYRYNKDKQEIEIYEDILKLLLDQYST